MWILLGCPSGFYLGQQTCQLCPATFYCTGRDEPPVSCPEGLFSVPGSISLSNCTSKVFVIVAIKVPIFRLAFNDEMSNVFQNTLATCAFLNPVYVILDIIQSGSNSTTIITSSIAASDTQIAASIFENLGQKNFSSVCLGPTTFRNGEILSLQVTACLPGSELIQSSQTCQLCPASFFCAGGVLSKQPCPSGYFSPEGSNSSDKCKSAVFVDVSINVPMSQSEFTPLQFKFRSALAMTAGVSTDRVIVGAVAVNSVRRTSSSVSLNVDSQIAAADQSSASAISNNVNQQNLNSNFAAQGIPQSTLASVDIISNSGGGVSSSVALGSALGGFIFLITASFGGYFTFRTFWLSNAKRLFISSYMKAKAGDPATSHQFPPALDGHYTATKILGKGTHACVVQAEKKTEPKVSVAVKLIIPSKSKSFDEKEIRQLRQEQHVLNLFTARKCEHAVLLAGLDAFEVCADVCWFIMEFLDGDDMEKVVYGKARFTWTEFIGAINQSFITGRVLGPIQDTECIQMARNVLAALKVMHSEGVLHRDIKPANVIRTKANTSGEPRTGFVYKLIDFGTAHCLDETVDSNETTKTFVNNHELQAGTPPYMSPEMYREPGKATYSTDVWSLGVTMFEVATASLPFEADIDLLWNLAIAGNMDEKAPSVLDRLPEEQRHRYRHILSRATRN